MRKGFVILLLFITGLAYAGDPVKDMLKAAGDATTYPNDNLVVVFDSTFVDVQETGLSYITTHTLTKALNYKGALELSVVKFGYDPLSAFVDVKKVLIHKTDGSVKEIDVSTVMDYPAPARAIYWGAMEKMIEVGRLEPGDAVEVIQFKKGFTYALLAGEEDDSKYIPPMKGHFYDIIEFWSGNPLKVKFYQVSVPKDKPLQYQFYNGEVQSSVWFKGDKVVYGFSKKDILPLKSESRMVALSDVAPKLLLSTSPDWYAKSKWFYKVNEDFGSFETTPEITAKVNEILKGAKDEMDSVSRLTHWCADEIRYSGISMGCGEGYTLHKGSMTFSDRCGVCKDKAGMLITMLRAAGFQSYAAMTMAGSRIDYIPADQFNHSVTVVKLRDGKYHLLDPTWVPFIRELWSSAEQQQQYLMGLPEGADLATTPVSPPENHYLKISGKSELSKEGTITGTLVLTAEGQTDASVRTGFFRNSNKTQWFSNVEKELLKISPRAEVTQIEYGDPINYMAGPIKITIRYTIPEYATISGDKVIFTPLVAAGVFRSLQPHLFFETGTKEKKYPFRDRCSRLVELSETVTLPAGYSIYSKPESKQKPGEVCSFTGGYSLDGNQLVLTEKASFGKRIYDAKDWPQFRDAVNAQISFIEEPVIFSIR
jgi:transglutaminase-like putative cysteine protease